MMIKRKNYEDDKIVLWEIIEELPKEDKHFSTISYEPTGYMEVVGENDNTVQVKYYHRQPKMEEHLYIYNCEKAVLQTPPNFIPYNCCDGYKEDVCIDKCLEEEIKSLWANNIVTLGCCCGHGRNLGFIQVAEGCIDKMRSMGYQNYIYGDECGGVERKDAFIPKTTWHIYDGYSDGHLG